MSPAQRPIQRTRSFNTPAAFEELQKLKAEVRRLKWKLKLTEGRGEGSAALGVVLRRQADLMLCVGSQTSETSSATA